MGQVKGTCTNVNKRTGKKYCEFPSADCRKEYKNLLKCADYYKCANIITDNTHSCMYSKCSAELTKV